jgi:hypothetical protein
VSIDRVVLRACCAGVMLAVCAPVSRVAAQEGVPLRPPQPATATAWEQSLALETQGDVARAKQVLIAAFGEYPTTYDVSVRLAWLSLLLHQTGEAVDRYRLSRTMMGSLPEATYGLSLALTARGYAALSRGAYGTSRIDLDEALALDSTNADARKAIGLLGGPRGIAVEAWAAAVSATKGSSRAQVFYLSIPFRLDETRAVRVVVRQVAAPTGIGTTRAFSAQTELYAGFERDIGIATIEAMGLAINATGGTSVGALLAGRVGGTLGLSGTASAISVTGGVNVQAVPSVFWWASPHVALSVGARITDDPNVRAVSPIAAMTIRGDRVALDLAGHSGTERWALSPAGPTILSFLDQTRYGGSATLTIRATPRVSVFSQAQIEQTASLGSFQSYGAGFRFSPR